MERPLEPYRGMDAEFDLLVVDTEFTRLPLRREPLQSWARLTEILSVGIFAVSQDLRPAQLYLTREVDAAVRRRCPPFVTEHVLPLLQAAPAERRFRVRDELRGPLSAFVENRRRAGARRPALVADWFGDLFLLAPLFPQDVALVLAEETAEVIVEMERGFTGGLRRHNALHDAQVIARGLQRFLDGTDPKASSETGRE